jgi:hypothetical protein
VRPGAETRVEYADLLAADPATRPAARAEYEAALRAAPQSRRARLGLARVLAADRDTSRAAIPQYRAVLAQAPQDAEAHRGLARAYAWNGDRDRALAHARAAGAGRPGGDPLARALQRGREPTAGGGAWAVSQPTGALALSASRVFATARGDPSPFTTASADLGAASCAGEGHRAEGALAVLGLEWRPDPGQRLQGLAGWDALRPGNAALSGALRLEWGDGERTLSVGVVRSPRQDSFRAFAGVDVAGRRVGAASDEVVEVRGAMAAADARLEVTARAGQVEGAGMPSTFLAAASARADRAISRSGAWVLSLGAAAAATHHGRDLSGLDGDPLAPRLYSPSLFVALSPRVALSREVGPARFLVDAGPALQHASGPGGALRAGGDARLSLAQPVGERLRLGLDLRAERIAGAYTRLEAGATVAVAF